MGIELDVLVGHPEHDLLFVATQVARAVGLKNPSHAVFNYHRVNDGLGGILSWEVVRASQEMRDQATPLTVKHLQGKSWMASEAWVYRMLLKGHAPASEPFRKWVTEEVLPTIRKTGSYDASKSDSPIAQGIMDEARFYVKLMRLAGV